MSEYEMARERIATAEVHTMNGVEYVRVQPKDRALLLDHDAEAVGVAEDALKFIEGYGANREGAQGAAVRSLAKRLRNRLEGQEGEPNG